VLQAEREDSGSPTKITAAPATSLLNEDDEDKTGELKLTDLIETSDEPEPDTRSPRKPVRRPLKE
jgi:hypothetical protein